MKRKITIVTILIALSILSACGGKKEQATSKPSTQPTPIASTKATPVPTKVPTPVPSKAVETPTPTETPKVIDNVKATKFADLKGEVGAGILFDQNKTMYVAKDGELLKITPKGKISTLCSFKDVKEARNYYFKSPLIWDMTFDKDGNILAAAQDRILQISPKGKVKTLIQEDFKGFLGTTGIACDKQGNFYITNGSKIEKVSPKLERTTFIDGSALGFNNFFALEFDPESKNLYATDFYKKNLLKYEIDANGKASDTPVEVLKEPIKFGGNYGCPLNITFSEKNNMYLSIDGMNTILKMDPNGAIEELKLGDGRIYNHIIAFGTKGFDEESFYITTLDGNVYQYKVGDKASK